LMVRPMRKANTVAETAAMESLAALIPKGKGVGLKELAKLAVELCDVVRRDRNVRVTILK
jgi:hypothetical protein